VEEGASKPVPPAARGFMKFVQDGGKTSGRRNLGDVPSVVVAGRQREACDSSHPLGSSFSFSPVGGSFFFAWAPAAARLLPVPQTNRRRRFPCGDRSKRPGTRAGAILAAISNMRAVGIGAQSVCRDTKRIAGSLAVASSRSAETFPATCRGPGIGRSSYSVREKPGCASFRASTLKGF